jgi:hypothetical protein
MAIIDKPTDHFNTVLYTGTGSTQSITGVGFQPDLAWFKSRTNVDSHNLVDSVRGAFRLRSNSDTNEAATSVTLDSDGFTLGGESENNGGSMVAWNWKAGGTAVSNTVGDITSSVSANTDSGFSIVSYTGTGVAGTIGHGLGSTPSMYIVKKRSAVEDWEVYHKSLGATQDIRLNSTGAVFTSILWNNTEPTDNVFSVYTGQSVNNSGSTYIAYCFAEVKGFSKFGSYTGNGSADGTFIYTGFKPAFLITKKTSATAPWDMFDDTRNVINPVNSRLHPNASDTEFTNSAMNIDFVSNGFKIRTTDNELNTSSATYIYMAFAEQPFVTSTTNGSIPATAR